MSKPREPTVPKERSVTVRQMLLGLMKGAPKSLLELAMGAGIPEKDVADHIEHLKRSGRSKGVEIGVAPAVCLDCNFSFKKRDRLTTPSRCPVCGSERISSVRVQIVD